MAQLLTTVNEFNLWLQTEMDKRGWSQTDLAQRGGISRSSVSMLFSRDRPPGPDVCRAIAAAMRIPEELVFRKAGLLSSKAGIDETAERVLHLFAKLTPRGQDEVLEYVELKLRQEESDVYRRAFYATTDPDERDRIIAEIMTQHGYKKRN